MEKKQSASGTNRRRPAYQREFGWWQGYKNWRAAYSRAAEASIYLPKHKSAFYLRPGTSDAAVFEAFFLKRPYNLPAGLTPELIIDGGANIGCASIFFAQKYRGAKILAIEPDGENAELARRNAARYANVEVLEGALWPRETWLRIEAPDVDKYEFRVVESAREERESIRALTIPALMKMAGKERIDILKLDIEGAERELFSENAEWISRVGILIIELHDRVRPGCARELYKCITRRELDFTQKLQGENVVIFFNHAAQEAG